ncbi:MAG: nicotinate phosphoribosyltransferase [Candidatus Competibacteraceae bacterium]|nr:nicotinate phosphoribosyltransferase [Candidatus Competibacteraceae bacterium]
MIINSLLDTDLYKFTMMQAVLHQFPGAQVEYRFKCRDVDVDLRPCADAIGEAIAGLCTLRFTEDELSYLSSLRFMKPDFVDFLRLFHLQTRYVEVRTDAGNLEIIIRGPWLHTILFEVPVLALLNQIYFQDRQSEATEAEGWRRLQSKIETVRQHPETEKFRFADFGTRRRFSADWQRRVVAELAQALPEQCVGTSNVLLAKSLGLVPIGTMAHEFLQACQALGPRLAESQKFAFETWAREYRGELGIALSDVVGINAFLRDFDLYFCKLFDGARQDSGDPFEWAEKMIAHYREHRVDPRHKNLVFSDGLNLPKALAIYDRFKDEARLSFGIGTNLTNDLGHKALNIVIKMTECNGQPVAKLSDSAGKTMCRDETFLAYLRQVFGIR